MIKHGVVIVVLSVLTQVGGLAWLLAIFTKRVLLWFIAAYLTITVATHYVSPLAGRVPLPCLDAGPSQIAVLNPGYCLLNRNYVTPEMKTHADALAQHMHDQFPGTRTRALDGSFPFVNGFPLLPHLSHNSGNQLDLALFYTNAEGTYELGRAKSFIGYWGFEAPGPSDPQPCAGDTGVINLRWDMAWLQPYLRGWPLDETRTGAALKWLADNPIGTDYKIFAEPHLSQRLGVISDTVKFQGCSAARHDDHLHLQFQP